LTAVPIKGLTQWHAAERNVKNAKTNNACAEQHDNKHKTSFAEHVTPRCHCTNEGNNTRNRHCRTHFKH